MAFGFVHDPVGWRHGRQRIDLHAHAFEAFELIERSRPDRCWPASERSARAAVAVGCQRTVANVSSVVGGLLGSALGMNSLTVAGTRDEVADDGAGGGAEFVKTNTPSEVLGRRRSRVSASWMKKPLVLTPVTMPAVVTDWPANGEVSPRP